MGSRRAGGGFDMIKGVVGGVIGGAIGAAVWAAVTYFTGLKIGWIA